MKKLLLGLGMALMCLLAMPSMAMPATPMIDALAYAPLELQADAVLATDLDSVSHESSAGPCATSATGESLRQRHEHPRASDNYLGMNRSNGAGPGEDDEQPDPEVRS